MLLNVNEEYKAFW